TAEIVPSKVTQPPAAAAAAASPETAQKQVDPLLESSFKLMEVIHQIASNAEQRNGMSVVAIKKALDAKGYKTVTHKFLISSSLKGLTEKSFRTHTKGISGSPINLLTEKLTMRKFSKAKSPGAKMTEKPIAYNKPKPTKTRKLAKVLASDFTVVTTGFSFYNQWKQSPTIYTIKPFYDLTGCYKNPSNSSIMILK
uniref:H15 domain-containing protein n=1 Tax=Callorhinchus milii TaxID=7868 RepID=A0A4W3GJ88_CALMI